MFAKNFIMEVIKKIDGAMILVDSDESRISAKNPSRED